MAKFRRNSNQSPDYTGFVLIGDPHLEGRQPGFRKDDFPNVILDKLQWCLDYASTERLLPVFLGDLFDKPRDNPTWMIGRLIEMLSQTETIGIYGNHDCADPELNDHDSLSLLVKSGCFRIVGADAPWHGFMNDRPVFVGGSSYRQPIPRVFKIPDFRSRQLFDDDPFVMWLTHHDIDIAGYENGRFKPYEIENVDLLVNGHIHRRLETVVAGRTSWMTPGNITRRSRNDATQTHVPRILRVDVRPESYQVSDVEVPHQAFDDVFHESVTTHAHEASSSNFISGLSELNARRTDSGAGLKVFLMENLDQFESPVVNEIKRLAEEVIGSEDLNDV